LKCPVCSDKLDVDVKLRTFVCHGCGWEKAVKAIMKPVHV